jgi:hypothetical protein
MKAIDGVRHNAAVGAASLARADFVRRAEEILSTITRVREQWGLQEAVRVATEQFVDTEPHMELAQFGRVVALARRQALIQQQLNDDREQLHHGHLDHEELVSLGHHYEMLRREACEYNHELRGLIENFGHYFSREELTDWLVEASQGRRQWTRSEITGAVSEIAMHAALQGLPELRGLRYATLDEDLAGFDFVATWDGQMVTLDAKTGLYQPLAERKHGHMHLEISVPREAVKDFRVTRRGLNLLRHEVRQALGRSGGRRRESEGYAQVVPVPI